MKTKLSCILFLLGTFLFGQEVKTKTSIFSVNPNHNYEIKTNGINVGVMDDYNKQKINGLNLQANPLSLIYPLIPRAIDVPSKEKVSVIINGLHISTGGLVEGEKLNGIGISMYHHSRITNGLSVNFYNNTSGSLNGIHISGFTNNSEKGLGINVAFLGNYSEDFKGVQISTQNSSEKMKGLQIGIVNKSNNLRGVQIGLWNVNERRKFPIINWNFKIINKTEKS